MRVRKDHARRWTRISDDVRSDLCQERWASGEGRNALLGSKLFEQEFRAMSGRNLCQERRANSEEHRALLGSKLLEIVSSAARAVGSVDAGYATVLLVSARLSRLFFDPGFVKRYSCAY